MERKSERPLGELLSELAEEVSTLFRQETDLARTELSGKASKVGRAIGMIAAGGAIAYAGLLALVAGIIILLANLMPWWASALLTGALVAAAGYILVQQGLNTLRSTDMVPRRTIATLKRIGNGDTTVRRQAA